MTGKEDIGHLTVPDQRFGDVMAALGGSVRRWSRLAADGRLVRPTHYLGARLRFADGTESVVFRETVLLGAGLTEPSVLAVRFRLRLLGPGRLGHALFRAACLVNTPLFAGFPGFVTKLWLADLATGEYRGVYDWDGARAARNYADPLTALLRAGSVPGSVDYHVVPGRTRAEFLNRPSAVDPLDIDPIQTGPGRAGLWWRLREPIIMPRPGSGW